MRTTLIAAVAANGVIGRDNDLPWKIPSDLAHFKRTTLGHPMLMGRKTFESFGSRPLPKRHHIILSRTSHGSNQEGITWVRDLDEAFNLAEHLSPELFVIGGAHVFQQALPRANRMILSELHRAFGGDVRFPIWTSEDWYLTGETIPEDEPIPYTIRSYTRRG